MFINHSFLSIFLKVGDLVSVMVGSTSSFSSTRKRRRSGQSDASSSIVSEDATNPMSSGLPIDLISPASSNVSSKKKARNVVNTPGNLVSTINGLLCLSLRGWKSNCIYLISAKPYSQYFRKCACFDE